MHTLIENLLTRQLPYPGSEKLRKNFDSDIAWAAQIFRHILLSWVEHDLLYNSHGMLMI